MDHTLEIVATPRDGALAIDAARLAAGIPHDLSEPEAVVWLQRELRRTYPNAVVRPQAELARSDASPYPVWYVSSPQRMFRIDIDLVVPLPPATAFAIYVDRVVEWQTAVDLVPRHPAGARLAERAYDGTYRFLGHAYAGSFRVLDADAPHSVTYQATGSGISVWYTTTFDPAPEGCRVTIKGDYDLPDTLLARIADRLILERAIARDIARANEAYAALCREGQPT